MLSGKLMKTLLIQRKDTINNHGIQENTWIDYLTIKAYQKNISRSLSINNQELFDNEVLIMQTRYNAYITTDMRVKYNNKYYLIVNIDETQDINRDLTLYLKKINN